MLGVRRVLNLPIVRSWTGWNRLSVNCSRRQDLPTPVMGEQQMQKFNFKVNIIACVHLHKDVFTSYS